MIHRTLKWLFVLCAMAITPILRASDVITYTATNKLSEVTVGPGLHTNAFNVSITSHTFAKGQGTIIYAGEVNSIGNGAFYGCTSLSSITIPNSVTSIGEYAFWECSSIQSITIGNSVTHIGYGAFMDCSSLTSITIPNSVTHIGNWAFEGCTSLTTLSIPNSVTSIGYYAFSGVNNVVYSGTATGSPWDAKCLNGYVDGYLVYTDASKTTLAGCFSAATGSITIPNSVISIGSRAFSNCISITSVSMPNSVINIGNEAFSNCISITSVSMPNSVINIGNEAFSNCISITSVTIPNSVISIGSRAFSNCTSITSINVDAANTHYASIDGVLSNYEKDTLIQYPVGNTRTTYSIPNNVTTIGNYAFSGHSSLTSITIPYGVTSIGEEAFEGCSSLTSITIPNSVTNIGGGAFEMCTSLQSITIPNSVTSIGHRAFSGCDAITSITWNAKNCITGGEVFSHDSQVKTFIFGDSVQVIPSMLCSGMRHLTSITIPNSVTHIGNWAFEGCMSLSNVTIGNSVISIESHAFSGCFSIRSITIPNSVTSIGAGAFNYCSSLTSITIPNSVTNIGDGAFEDCSSLQSITSYATTPPTCGSNCFYNVDKSIPLYVLFRSINTYKTSYTWKDFTNIKPIIYGIVTTSVNNPLYGSISGDGAQYDTICTLMAIANCGYHFTQWSDGNTDNPRSFILTQDTAFKAQFAMAYSGKCGDSLYWQYDNGILTITGSGVMYNEIPWVLFADSICQVNLPNGLTAIGTGSFQNMSKLNSIVIPASVTSISADAFDGCRKLYDIYCYAIEPPLAQTSSFENYNVYLHVPCDNLKDYQMDAVFGSFKYIECIGAEETITTSVTVVPSTNSVDITWPTTTDANSYTIEIKKDEVVFCTLTFNAQGQLTSIAFAPGRGTSNSMHALAVAGGYKFTVTSLSPATKYNYEIDTQNASGTSLANYTGEFTTTSGTALDQLSDSPSDRFTKVMKDGQLYILRDGKTYNAKGGEL